MESERGERGGGEKNQSEQHFSAMKKEERGKKKTDLLLFRFFFSSAEMKDPLHKNSVITLLSRSVVGFESTNDLTMTHWR